MDPDIAPSFAAEDFVRGQDPFLEAILGERSQATSLVPLSLHAKGGIALETAGSDPGLQVGYVRVLPVDNGPVPAGMAVFGFRQNGILIGEATVPGAAATKQGQFAVESSSSVRTGFAVVNAGAEPTTISYRFLGRDGAGLGSGSTTLSAGEQTARFLDEAPFNSGILPPAGPAYLPHFAIGGGWTTQILLLNTTTAPVRDSLQFWGQGGAQAGTPVPVVVNGQTTSAVEYDLPPGGADKLVTTSASPDLQAGSLWVLPGRRHTAASGSGDLLVPPGRRRRFRGRRAGRGGRLTVSAVR